MTYEQYWDGDTDAHKYYKRAYKLKVEDENRNAWLSGMYIYEALVDVSPLLRAFSKAKSASPYRSEPIELWKSADERAQERQKKREDAAMKKAKTAMEIFTVGFNQHFEQKKLEEEVEKNG